MSVPKPELSRPIVVAALKPAGETRHVTATPAEAAALAQRLGLEAVRDFDAEVTLKPRAKGQVVLRGRLRATLGRLCVVTLEPLDEVIDERIAAVFVPAERAAPGVELSVAPEGEDDEPYEGPGFDLGEYLAQTLAVALDPWPRAPGASLPPVVDG
ncbi:DUF177 domain-containing protein [Elioraea sp.]|uniref:YceD family protein n=1 Tax=Elioraea sp. TaxID=2185103 RepID=UPI0025C145DF|nr:DUF177 domain-containing protein [Elioraea sp.]